MEIEINKLFEKGAIQNAISQKNQFVNNAFLVKKSGLVKLTGQRPVNYLKELNQSISCQLFKMEGLYLLEEILEERSYFVS